MKSPSFDVLLSQLTDGDVRFVLVGGLALGAWGVVRGTKDCEIVPDPAPDNLDRLAVLATKIGGHTKLAEAGQRRIAGLVAGKNP